MNPFAIYFPQFYPTPTNDAAWGKGFTDWALVANANLRDGWTRRAPARGFYDGSSRQTHLEQITEAKQAGVGGFGVYHYWFYTHQELDAFESTLLSLGPGSPHGFPWFLIWACEGWSRRWMGDPTPLVELSAAPSRDVIRRHCEHLARCFEQPHYWRIAGRPLLALYHLSHFDQPENVIDAYRKGCELLGHHVHVTQFVKKPTDAAYAGLVDSNYLFEPRLFFAFKGQGAARSGVAGLRAARRLLGERATSRLLVLADRLAPRGKTYPADQFLDYMGSAEREEFIRSLGPHVQEVISPGWNNTPRYASRFTALADLPAEAFGALTTRWRSSPTPLLVNAWNEWSEGAAIEPCAYMGRRYLDAMSQSRPSLQYSEAEQPLAARVIS